MVQTSCDHHLGCIKTLQIMVDIYHINYLAGFLNHQQYAACFYPYFFLNMPSTHFYTLDLPPHPGCNRDHQDSYILRLGDPYNKPSFGTGILVKQ